MSRALPPRARSLLVALALALLAAAPYFADGGRRAFVLLDDDVYIYENRAVLDGLSAGGVRWAFTTFSEGNWHPLTWLAHMAVATLFGADPWWHHAATVALHALATALFFAVLLRLTGAAARSAFAAALFAVHPLHVESVAWAAELKDVLSGCFFMFVLLAYGRHVRQPGTSRFVVVALLLAAGLMAKSMLVTVPFVLLLLDWWPLGRCGSPGGAGRIAWGRALVEKAPLFALVLASSLLTFAAQRAGGAVVGADFLPVWDRIGNGVISCVDYLRTALCPRGLAVFYPYRPLVEPWRVAVGGAILAAAATAVLALRRRGYLATGWLWFVGMLVPVIGLVQIGGQARADRYMYLPLAGLAIVLAWGAGDGARRLGRPALTAGAAAVVVAVLATLATRQAGYWRDGETLFRRALAVTTDNAMIHNNLGVVLVNSGRTVEA
ncbi:MAG TPA: hypothetical protein VN317_05690, partial [Candidatus Methanoperedens sp.]|nr:hypothetical protein [Candidatus Methanoperedens sp.]